ncbi:MAG TPA: undecaprenyl-phosphate glucose phosphotransferase [Anaerolineae bacterium]|nr:undecaprenyl-phosphate glucose phosphotransferase [Anaerolineae bacterium]
MTPKYPRWLEPAVIGSDIVLINTAFLLAYYIRYRLQLFRPVDPAFDNPPEVYLPLLLLLMALLVGFFKLSGYYAPRRLGMWLDQMSIIIRAAPTAILVMIGITLLFQPFFYSRLIFLYTSILIVILLSVSRFVWVIVLGQLRRRNIGVSRVLIVGAGDVGRTVIRTVMAQPEFGYRIVALVDDRVERSALSIGPLPAIEGTQRLPEIIAEKSVDEVIVTLPWTDHQRILDIFQLCENLGVRVRTVPDLFQLSLNRVDVEDLGGVPVIGLKAAAIQGANLFVKRVMDVAIGSIMLLLTAPIMAMVALAIKLDSRGPVIFKQKRVGAHGQEFVVFKFRTMRQGADEEKAGLLEFNEMTGPLFKMRGDPRITRMGRFMRRSSLDELPQLFNVLRGEMSMVGPRPHTSAEVTQYQNWQRQVLEAPPGMTGLAQVSGRSQLSFDEQCLLDIYYIENWSPALDVKILLRTLPKWFSGEGAY